MTGERVTAGEVRLGTSCGRGVLLATVLGSGMSFLDGLVVNVALPKMDRELHLGVVGLQWTVSGYLLTLSALLLLGGSLGDQHGRRRVYLIGIALFVLASMGCGVAPNTVTLVVARIVQGVGGALLVPTSLAVIQSVFVSNDRAAAIGAWTGFTSVLTALGPFVGGFFVTYLSWRWAFFINAPLGVLAAWATLRWVPECREENRDARPDVAGAVLAALGLAGVTYWAIEGPAHTSSTVTLFTGIGGLATLMVFILVERRTPSPMLPLGLFRSAQFDWVNVCTVIFYGAFVTGVTFLGVQLQTDMGYSPLLAGVAALPVSVMMFVLSSRFGAWSSRIGPKIPMTLGAALVGGSLLAISQIHAGRHYWTFVFPIIVLWGLGLSMMVAPLTAAALASADERHAGVASAINNAASRVGQSVGIALLPVLAGLGGGTALGGGAFSNGYERLMLISGALSFVAALIALVFVEGTRSRARRNAADVLPAA